MRVSGETFEQACQAQGVELIDPISNIIQRANDFPLRRLVTSAGDFLAQERDRPLATGLLEQPIHPEYTVSRILQRIINASIEHEDGRPLDFDCGVEFRASACGAAEPAFAKAFRDMKDSRHQGQRVRYGGALYVDDDGQAFAFTKSEGFGSTLALRDITIQGVPFPAGSILYAQREDYTPEYGRQSGRFTIHRKDEITGINFTRLSAFASPPDQRDECFDNDIIVEAGPEAYDFLSTAATTVLQPLAQQVVVAYPRLMPKPPRRFWRLFKH